jgi:hypothetical protein
MILLPRGKCVYRRPVCSSGGGIITVAIQSLIAPAIYIRQGIFTNGGIQGMQLKRPALVAALAAIGLLALPATQSRVVQADSIEAIPQTFVGTAPGCAPFPPGSRIVASAWLNGLGLPDNGGPNTSTTNANPPTRNDPHSGLLLSKNGPTADCSEAGARITGVAGMTLSELGFDYRNGGHCGAGAPRFNVEITSEPAGTDHFFGCADGTQAPAPQDPTQWTRVRFTLAQASPPVPPNSTIRSISIVFDEGTDTPSTQDPNGVGLATIDNIDINGHLITSGPSHGNGDDNDQNHGNGHGDGDDGGHGHGHGHGGND